VTTQHSTAATHHSTKTEEEMIGNLHAERSTEEKVENILLMMKGE
jgi:hypothetical protein